MTNARTDHSLSRFELVVLARLSTTKPPNAKSIAEAVTAFATSPEAPTRVDEVVADTLAALRRRSLIKDRQAALTEEGKRTLRAVFNLPQVPSWSDVRSAHLLARALGLQPGSEQAEKTLQDGSTIALAVLRKHFDLPERATIPTICDALIADELKLPRGPMTLARIRAGVLARRTGASESDPAGTPKQIVVRLAGKTLGIEAADKRSMGRELGRRWLYELMPGTHSTISSSPRTLPTQPGLPLPAPPIKPPVAAQNTVEKPPQTSSSLVVAKPMPDALLTAVRDAIPRIGAAGRFGAEKVFVSALWQRLEHDNHIPDLSFERFKRWLITANRDQLIDLARADLVGAMDPKLVAESEIEYLGTTFHFVVDRHAIPAARRGIHAR